jgi:Rps23 Pro-64 3,4-dihydroxylase Tpa1-like proline 4-hydroxylase
MSIDRAALEPWIQSHHLEDGALASYRDSLAGHPAKLLTLRDLLVGDRAERLSHFLMDEAEYETEYGIYSVEEAVSESAFQAADDQDRFFRLSRLHGVPAEHQFSPNALAYLQFRQALQTEAFRGFFETVSGLPLTSSDDFGVHSMRTGDFLRHHTDDNKDRRLALVMYLTPDWRPEFGGTLSMVDDAGTTHVIHAEYNSIVMFDVQAESAHEVLPVEAESDGLPRLSIGGWYHRTR